MALSFSINATVSPQSQVKVSYNNGKSLASVKNLVNRIGVPSLITSPQESLHNGNWVKLICGASFEDVVDIRNLSLVYTLAGVDCIDCAAEASVVRAVNQGIEAAMEIAPMRRPWTMISVNDDEDLHFRKAEFDPEECPLDCSKPCEIVCPANAISLERQNSTTDISQGWIGGVKTERCYGCGRCFPVCPYDKIREITYVRDAKATAELLERSDVDAIEIHTSGRQTKVFEELWNGLGDSVRCLKLVAVSLPDNGDTTISTMNTMYSIMESCLCCSNLWQLDGRPMSGDMGRGATRESIAFAVRLAATKQRPHGFLQLAGGTNAHTAEGLKKEGLFQSISSNNFSKDAITTSATGTLNSLIGGIAFGGYARKIVGKVLNSLPSHQGPALVEDYPEHLFDALLQALALVGTVKLYDPSLLSK